MKKKLEIHKMYLYSLSLSWLLTIIYQETKQISRYPQLIIRSCLSAFAGFDTIHTVAMPSPIWLSLFRYWVVSSCCPYGPNVRCSTWWFLLNLRFFIFNLPSITWMFSLSYLLVTACSIALFRAQILLWAYITAFLFCSWTPYMPFSRAAS